MKNNTISWSAPKQFYAKENAEAIKLIVNPFLWLRIVVFTVFIALIAKYCIVTSFPLIKFNWIKSIIISIIMGLFLTFVVSLQLLISKRIILKGNGINIIQGQSGNFYLYDNIRLVVIEKERGFTVLTFDYNMRKIILPLDDQVDIGDVIHFLQSKALTIENKIVPKIESYIAD